MTQAIQKKLNDSAWARWTALILVALTMFFGYMFVDVLSPLQNMLESTRGWSPTIFGLYGGSEFILNVCGFLLVAGIILDKMGVRFTGILSASLMVGDWAAPVVSAITALACLTSLGSWMMLVTQAGARAAQEGYIPKIYGELDKNGLPRKGLILSATQMTVLMAVITAMNASGGSASDLFGMITGIAVLLTMLPYFYSCVNLLRIEGATTRNVISCVASVLGSGFCFIALAGAGFNQLIATFIVSLVIMMFFSWKRASSRRLSRLLQKLPTSPKLARLQCSSATTNQSTPLSSTSSSGWVCSLYVTD